MGPVAVSISPGDRIAQLVLVQHAFASWDTKKDVSEFPDTGAWGPVGSVLLAGNLSHACRNK